jgi:hypothetical protein
MNKYDCWIDGRKAETRVTLEAETAFEARKRLAAQYGVHVTDVVAARIWE